MAEILLVEDEANARKLLKLGLEARGHQVVACDGPDSAHRQLQQRDFDVVLTDLRMEGRDAGLEVVKAGSELCPNAKILLLTAYASADTAVAAMKLGAFDYLTKPVSGEELGLAIERALEDASGTEKALSESSKGERLIGRSEPMQRVRTRMLRAAESDFTVLISGESGTGKELAARFIHEHSARSSGPFVPVNCGAIPETLFESELFGYARGAFTGAESDRMGLIESANRGTLFLDEVGEMPIIAQVKLLRVLQEKLVRRVGESMEREVDVRVIAATNRDLEEEVRQGCFREDLYFRLNVLPVHMPPLRQRREDIPLLIEGLMRQWGGDPERITPSCMERLVRLPYMGNVRELENLLQRMLALSGDGPLDVSLLEEIYAAPQQSESISLAAIERDQTDLDSWMQQVEKRLIKEALHESKGKITKAAERLGISFRSLRYRMAKLGIKDGGQ